HYFPHLADPTGFLIPDHAGVRPGGLLARAGPAHQRRPPARWNPLRIPLGLAAEYARPGLADEPADGLRSLQRLPPRSPLPSLAGWLPGLNRPQANRTDKRHSHLSGKRHGENRTLPGRAGCRDQAGARAPGWGLTATDQH